MSAGRLDESQRKAAVAIAKCYWRIALKAQHPNATKEEKQASWQQSRAEYLKLGKSIVRTMVKSGFQISGGPAPK